MPFDRQALLHSDAFHKPSRSSQHPAVRNTPQFATPHAVHNAVLHSSSFGNPVSNEAINYVRRRTLDAGISKKDITQRLKQYKGDRNKTVRSFDDETGERLSRELNTARVQLLVDFNERQAKYYDMMDRAQIVDVGAVPLDDSGHMLTESEIHVAPINTDDFVDIPRHNVTAKSSIQPHRRTMKNNTVASWVESFGRALIDNGKPKPKLVIEGKYANRPSTSNVVSGNYKNAKGGKKSKKRGKPKKH